ncbi:hypothetical protein EKE94_14655 [Mesobaculum littorinae]|uniref:Lipoprotein n=1 Tax=Mesobaculum littorinae TaxID=2486419 RepID=A0A438AEX2_9RHOB|nr:hypothetical protein [Mesobaculum littorinae]RVV97253.1 hypothetical protein EKE94_14655 [Mesobaculum littorinae]
MMRAMAGLVCVAMLAGCGLGERVGLGAARKAASLPYSAQLDPGADPRDFAVAVKAGPVGVDAVRESVRYPATRYCLTTFGTSDAIWRIDPQTEDWAAIRDGDRLLFGGRCTAR